MLHFVFNDALVNQVLERLILERIQMQMGQHAGVVVTDEQLQQTIKGIATQNKLTVDEFIATLAKDGVSYNEFREQVRREILIVTSPYPRMPA